MATQTTMTKPIADLEKLLAESGAQMQAAAPEQHARVKRLVVGLKKADPKKLPQELQRDLMELYRWQLETQKQGYLAQLETLKSALKTGDPLAKQADEALRKVVEVLELGISGAASPTDAAQKKLEKVAAQAREAMLVLDKAYAKRLSSAAMRPVPGGAIVSPGGVALKAVAPPKKVPDAPLQAFRLLPGTVKASAPRPSKTTAAPPPASKPGPAKKK